MSKPEIKEHTGHYEFYWEDEKINIIVSRIKIHSDGTVKGELQITTDAPGYAPFFHRSQFNFSSSQSMSTLQKKMSERYQADWLSIIEQLCYYTLDIARRGEPTEEIWAKDDIGIIPPRFILEPLMLEGLPTVLFGKKGAGKSTMAMVIAICLHLPWYDNNLGFRMSPESLPVLILDWEQSRNIVLWQINSIRKGMGLPEFPIYYRRCYLPLADDIDQIQQHIIENNIKVVIVDSLGPACGGELNKPEPALAFFNNLRKLNVSSLIVGQTSKDEDAKVRTIFGAVFFQYLARSIWEIRKSQEIENNIMEVALYHRDGNYTPKYSSMGFRISYGINGINISRCDIKSIRELVAGISTQEQLLNILGSEPLSKKEMMEEINISEGALRIALHRLREKGKVIKLDNDKWGLAYEG